METKARTLTRVTSLVWNFLSMTRNYMEFLYKLQCSQWLHHDSASHSHRFICYTLDWWLPSNCSTELVTVDRVTGKNIFSTSSTTTSQRSQLGTGWRETRWQYSSADTTQAISLLYTLLSLVLVNQEDVKIRMISVSDDSCVVIISGLVIWL